MTTTTTPSAAWAQLPNAARIDRVLKRVRAHPQAWVAAGVAAWDAAWDAAWVAARDAAGDAAWDAARDAALDAARGAARVAAQSAALFLVAYDDLGYLLDDDTPLTTVRAVVAMEPACVLIVPALIAIRGYER